MKTGEKIGLAAAGAALTIGSIIALTKAKPPKPPTGKCTPGQTKCWNYDLYTCGIDAQWYLSENESLKCGFVPTTGPDIRVEQITVEPPTCFVGSQATIIVVVANHGSEAASKTVTLGGDISQSQTITLQYRDRVNVYFYFMPPEARSYTITTDGLSANLTAIEKPTQEIPFTTIPLYVNYDVMPIIGGMSEGVEQISPIEDEQTKAAVIARQYNATHFAMGEGSLIGYDSGGTSGVRRNTCSGEHTYSWYVAEMPARAKIIIPSLEGKSWTFALAWYDPGYPYYQIPPSIVEMGKASGSGSVVKIDNLIDRSVFQAGDFVFPKSYIAAIITWSGGVFIIGCAYVMAASHIYQTLDGINREHEFALYELDEAKAILTNWVNQKWPPMNVAVQCSGGVLGFKTMYSKPPWCPGLPEKPGYPGLTEIQNAYAELYNAELSNADYLAKKQELESRIAKYQSNWET